jgi:hypothetical protein
MIGKSAATLLMLLPLGSPPPLAQAPGSVAAYDMHLTLDPAGRRLSVTGSVRLPALPVPRDSVRLVLWSRMQDVRFELIAPASQAVVTTDSADGDRSWLLRPTSPIPAGT